MSFTLIPDFRDNLSRIFTRPMKTLGEKYFRAVRAFGRNTKTGDAGAATQPKRRGQGAVRRANGLSTVETVDPHCDFARHHALSASFRPSGRPRAAGHETLRVTKGHENARPSIASGKRRSQTSGRVWKRELELIGALLGWRARATRIL